MIDIIPVDLIVHKNQAVPDILRVIFLGSVSQASTVPASKLNQDRRSVLGKRHLLYRLAIAGVPLRGPAGLRRPKFRETSLFLKKFSLSRVAFEKM